MGLTVHLAGISKTYRGAPILKDITYTFAAGQHYLLMGDNGSGKSTLFRIAALLEAPDRGELRYLDGDRVLALDIDLKRKITMVFPKVGVLSRTVFENVAYGLKIRGMNNREIRERVAGSLEKVALTHKSAQLATTLSSGETMRLGLARALAIEPKVLFLDEPTTHIDKHNTRLIEEVIGRIRQEQALTLIIISHDPAQADRLGGRRLWLSDGKIEEQ
ncbi:MAG: ATP-binding cassette domain-containing protein [Desulfobaccales bacterium]